MDNSLNLDSTYQGAPVSPKHPHETTGEYPRSWLVLFTVPSLPAHPFVVLTFSAFFLFENLKSLSIHPVQYSLVGLAQALFFLLLTSLSEHIAFSMAYLVAAIACITLISIYLAAILRDWYRGFGFSFALATLYAALFGISL